MSRGKMSSRQEVASRRAEALAMRRQGRTMADIAATLGYASPSSASKDVHRALQAAVMEQGRALLTLERERLDALQAILWPLAEAGDVRAARELVRLLERRARMLGIDRAAGAAEAVTDQQNMRAAIAGLGAVLEAAAREQGLTTT